MKYFIIEGFIKDAAKMNDAIMEEHKKYTGKAMENGMTFMSGLKSDMSGGIFIMKADTLEDIENYLNNEPFKQNGIQEYKVTEFSAHYLNPSSNEWFQEN